MTVKRYDPSIADGDGWEIGDASPCMEECEVGDYVKHDDYAALAARLAEAERKLKNYEPTNLYNGLTIDQWKARCDEAEALLKDAQYLLGDGPACDDFHIKLRAFLAKHKEQP